MVSSKQWVNSVKTVHPRRVKCVPGVTVTIFSAQGTQWPRGLPQPGIVRK